MLIRTLDSTVFSGKDRPLLPPPQLQPILLPGFGRSADPGLTGCDSADPLDQMDPTAGDDQVAKLIETQGLTRGDGGPGMTGGES